jgi:hypothetical protein
LEKPVAKWDDPPRKNIWPFGYSKKGPIIQRSGKQPTSSHQTIAFSCVKKGTYSGLSRALPHSSWMNLRIPVAFVNAGHSPD